MEKPDKAKLVPISWTKFDTMTKGLLTKIKSVKIPFDSIVAISKGGLPLGVVLAHNLNIPLLVVSAKRFLDGKIILDKDFSGIITADEGSPCRRVLIVDEICDDGVTMTEVFKMVETKFKPDLIYTAVLFKRYWSKFNVNFVETILKNKKEYEWIVFPWEPEKPLE
jgi:hypoxanthine phosphoribosyltransferase